MSNNYHLRHRLPNAAQIVTNPPPGALIHYTAFSMHQVSVQQPSGAKFSAWAAAWSWVSNSTTRLPPAAVHPDMVDLIQIQPQMLFDPSIQHDARLPWAHGQPPPPLLMPPQQPGFFRRLLGGGGK